LQLGQDELFASSLPDDVPRIVHMDGPETALIPGLPVSVARQPGQALSGVLDFG
jgi:hypothetical protein